MKVGSVIYKGFILMICIFGAGLVKGETTIDALFQNAMEQIGQVSRKESIQAFEEIISKDRNYAPAYNELAKLHLLDHSVNGRQRAMRRIQQAIAIDSDNVEYRLTRGKIMWHQGFRSRALNQFKNVIKKDPQNTAVLNGLGMFWVYDFLAQKDRRSAQNPKNFKIFCSGSQTRSTPGSEKKHRIGWDQSATLLFFGHNLL